MKESQVVIDVHDLTLDEKAPDSLQPPQARKAAAGIPDARSSRCWKAWRRIRALCRRPRGGWAILSSPKDLYLRISIWIDQFVEKQEQLLQEVLQGLDGDSKAALGLIYMRNGDLESPIELEESESRALERLGSSLGGCTTALEALKGSLVQQAYIEGASIWRFKHPTIGDAFAAQLVRNPELLEIYIQGSPTEDLIGQVTCGDVGLEKAVIIPKSTFRAHAQAAGRVFVEPEVQIAAIRDVGRQEPDHGFSGAAQLEGVSLVLRRKASRPSSSGRGARPHAERGLGGGPRGAPT